MCGTPYDYYVAVWRHRFATKGYQRRLHLEPGKGTLRWDYPSPSNTTCATASTTPTSIFYIANPYVPSYSGTANHPY